MTTALPEPRRYVAVCDLLLRVARTARSWARDAQRHQQRPRAIALRRFAWRCQLAAEGTWGLA